MTENEAIKELETSIDLAKMCTQNTEREKELEAYNTAIQALEEIQAYRAIGTVEEIKSMIRKSDFTQKPSKEELISELKELSKMKMILECYEAIGTVEEFKTLKEKNVAKSRIIKDGKYYCCSCNRFAKTSGHCSHCGQMLY